MGNLQFFSELEHVHIGQSTHAVPSIELSIKNPIRDQNLNSLAKLPYLLGLYLDNTAFTFSSITLEDGEVSNSKLKYLSLSGNYLSDATELVKLKIFSRLLHLNLAENSFTDTDFKIGDNKTLADVLPLLEYVVMKEDCADSEESNSKHSEK